KHNKFYFVVEPLEEEVFTAIKDGKIPEIRVKKKDPAIRDAFVEAGYDSKTATSVKEVFNGNVFIDDTRGQVYGPEVMEMVLDMFRNVMNQGPLAREPCVKVKVMLKDMKLHEDAIHRGPSQVYPAIRDGIRGAMMTGRPLLFEPQQVLHIEAPVDYMGEVSKIVNNKRGQLLDMQQEGSLTVIRAKLPVSEMFGWSSDLRSATGGRGSSSLVDQMFEKLPEELQQKVVSLIMGRKGLTAAQVGA
ncbi:TPA: elongation factor EF-2, partial [Candidatus Woesearchaeota archaeon]|nr:elongation factor EF-2 [Candidatus Woesearchaeota archaeon]